MKHNPRAQKVDPSLVLDKYCVLAFNQAVAEGTRFLQEKVARKFEENLPRYDMDATGADGMPSGMPGSPEEQIAEQLTGRWYDALYAQLSIQNQMSGKFILPRLAPAFKEALKETTFSEEDHKKIEEARANGLKSVASGMLTNLGSLHAAMTDEINVTAVKVMQEIGMISGDTSNIKEKAEEFAVPLHEKLNGLYWEMRDIVHPPKSPQKPATGKEGPAAPPAPGK